jgi:hypothetical protein
MDITIKEKISLYIDFLSYILPTNNDYEVWIPTCIECLQFALDNEKLLNEKPELYQDTLNTLYLLYSCIVKNEEWAYIELRQKFRKIYSPKEVGKALKEFSIRLSKKKEELYTNNCLIDFKDNNGDFKSVEQILSELSIQFNNIK